LAEVYGNLVILVIGEVPNFYSAFGMVLIVSSSLSILSEKQRGRNRLQ